MKKLISLGTVVVIALSLGACDEDKMMSERGFRLPDGDANAGRDTFIYMQCNQCHTVKGEDLPPIPGSEPYVELGGTVTHVRTYGELVTSIVNPSLLILLSSTKCPPQPRSSAISAARTLM